MFSNGEISEMKSKDEILDIISKNEFKNIFRENGISNIIIFGSLSNGNFSLESDVDIAIITLKKISINEELFITTKLEELLGRSVDIIDINDDSINNIIKIEALNSKFIVIKDNLLDKAIEYYDNLYKENEEFCYLLDKEVLSFE